MSVDRRTSKVLSVLGARQMTTEEREENDFYATPPECMEMLLERETFAPTIWECACGQGHLSKVLERNGHYVISTDLVDRGYGLSGVDFLKAEERPTDREMSIITNPPYSLAEEFVWKAMELLNEGEKCAMFLKIQFLEGKSRAKLFEVHPPKRVYVSVSRVACYKGGGKTHVLLRMLLLVCVGKRIQR